MGKRLPSPDRTNADESGVSDQESDDCSRSLFYRVAPEETPVNDKHISEKQRTTIDTVDEDEAHERVMPNWIQRKPRCRDLRTKDELNDEKWEKT